MGPHSPSLSPSKGERGPVRAGEGLPAESLGFHGSGCVSLLNGWVFRALVLLPLLVTGLRADEPASIRKSGSAWTLGNESLKARVEFSKGSIDLTSLKNVRTGEEMLSGTGTRGLFRQVVDGLVLASDDGGWKLTGSTIGPIEVRQRQWGKELRIEITRPDSKLSLTLVFEVWAKSADPADGRVLACPTGGNSSRRAACWTSPEKFGLTVRAPDAKPYRLTAYLLDYDRNGRTHQVTLTRGDGALLDAQNADAAATANGVYLSWTVTGSVELEVTKTAGFNAVASAVFVDAK